MKAEGYLPLVERNSKTEADGVSNGKTEADSGSNGNAGSSSSGKADNGSCDKSNDISSDKVVGAS